MKAILFAILISLIRFSICDDNPKIHMNTVEIITYNGYPSEIHFATTDDGYILTLHRIPKGRNTNEGNNLVANKSVVFLQHGLLDSSFTWVNNSPTKSLAFILADLGYDVWLGNTRGNIYSKNHKKLSPSSNAFWNFCWDEMAKYDFPAMINYVTSVTNVAKLTYIGHSQGTEIAFAKLSENGIINSKISSFVAIAPVAYLAHLNSATSFFSILAGPLNLMTQLLNHGEFLPNSDLISKLKSVFCRENMKEEVCSNILFMMNGYDTTNLDNSKLSIYLSHVPAGTSSKNIAHYAQSCRSKKFQMFDYGYLGNILRYWRLNPPTYSLNTHGIPVGIFYGGKDKSATPPDVEKAISELGNSVTYKSFIPNYSHVDLIWGVDAADILYKDLVTFIQKYQ